MGNIAKLEGLMDAYPNAYEDDKGTIWVSKEAADTADWTYEHGDAFLEGILGLSWAEAEECFIEAQKIRRHREWWKSHPRIRDAWWWIRCHWGFTSMLLSTVWRDWHGRITPSLAWTLAGDMWLRGGRSKKC